MKEHKNIDFFLCHASEDKESFVKDLADQLLRNGARVFYDEYSIFAGKSLTASINQGISESKNVVVILSQTFFSKQWTNAELQSVFNLHVYGETNLITVYHNIDPGDVREKYPLIADIKGLMSNSGFEKVADDLFKTAGMMPRISYMTIPPSSDNKNANQESASNIILGGISFPYFGDINTPRCIIEYGIRGVPDSRLRVVLRWSTILCLEVVDKKGRMLTATYDISHWNTNEAHFIIGSLTRDDCRLEIYCDGDIRDSIAAATLDLPDSFLVRTGAVMGASVDLHSFCPMTVGHLAYISSIMTIDQKKEYERLTQKYNI